MSVRRLDPKQPASFSFTPENKAWAKTVIASYPDGKQASAVIALLWRAQEQSGNWLPEPAIRYIAEMLDMAQIRVLEVATFYTMFQLSPVGRKAHLQVCGTTPCMLRGSEDLISLCKKRINKEAHRLSEDGDFSWEEVECLGACVNAPLVQVGKHLYEDLTPDDLDKVLAAFANGEQPAPGPYIKRQFSSPVGGLTTLNTPGLYDVKSAGAAGMDNKQIADGDVSATGTPTLAAAGASAVAAAMAPAVSGAAASVPTDTKASPATGAGLFGGAGGVPESHKPELLGAPRGGNGDDLSLILGVGDKLEKELHAMGIWHFDQIAAWTPDNITWFEAQFTGLNGMVARGKWIKQAKKLAGGWRPDSHIGEKV